MKHDSVHPLNCQVKTRAKILNSCFSLFEVKKKKKKNQHKSDVQRSWVPKKQHSKLGKQKRVNSCPCETPILVYETDKPTSRVRALSTTNFLCTDSSFSSSPIIPSWTDSNPYPLLLYLTALWTLLSRDFCSPTCRWFQDATPRLTNTAPYLTAAIQNNLTRISNFTSESTKPKPNKSSLKTDFLFSISPFLLLQLLFSRILSPKF